MDVIPERKGYPCIPIDRDDSTQHPITGQETHSLRGCVDTGECSRIGCNQWSVDFAERENCEYTDTTI